MKKILIIDDEKDFADALSIRLGSFGWSVSCCESPEKGLEEAKSLRPDLIIIDVIFPGETDGYDLAKKIKSDERLRETALIILSVCAMRNDIEKGLQTGADSYFTKPLDTLNFIEQVKAYLGEADAS